MAGEPPGGGSRVGRILVEHERAARMTKESAARIEGEGLRSAFAISAEHVLTAWHCVRDAESSGQQLWFRLRDASPGAARRYVYLPMRVLEWDKQFDVAVLLLDRLRLGDAGLSAGVAADLLARSAIPLGVDVSVYEQVRIMGFPGNAPSADSATLLANVADLTLPLGQVTCMSLFGPSLAAVEPLDAHGLSGGPVLKTGRGGEVAVGVVRGVPVLKSGGAALGGGLLATRVGDVAARLAQVDAALLVASRTEAQRVSAREPSLGGELSLRSLATRLDDSFVEHMQSGESLPALTPSAGRLTVFLDDAELIGPRSAEGIFGREEELNQIAEFCASDVRYFWLQGEAFGGKTALASWVFRHPPNETWAAAFFIRQLSASYRNAEHYAAVMTEQLSALAGKPIPDRHLMSQLDRLLHEAAAKADDAGRRLLLIIDGLDEDCTVLGEAITDLLPQDPPANVRVLVTSRTMARRLHLRHGHPLARCTPVTLEKSPRARELLEKAEDQLDDALRHSLSREVAGLLTASQGGLTVPGLANVTKRDSGEIRDVIDGVLGRNLRTDREGVLEFAHPTLLGIAKSHFAEDIPRYTGQLLSWADGYRERRWPAETPDFLLSPFYVDLLIAGSNAFRAAAGVNQLHRVAADRSRHDRMRVRFGSDGPAMAELGTLWSAGVSGKDADLALLALIAFERDRLSSRNQSIPAELPAVYAQLGEVGRAVELARNVVELYSKSDALISLAGVLGAIDPKLAERVAAYTGYQDWQAEALARAAVTAFPPNRDRFLRLAMDCALQTEKPDRRAAAAAAVAGALALRDPRQALGFAAEFTRITGESLLSCEPLTAIVKASAKAGDQQTANQAAVQIQQITTTAAYSDERRDKVLAEAASALWPADPSLAEQLVRDMAQPAPALIDLAVIAARTNSAAAAEFANRALAATQNTRHHEAENQADSLVRVRAMSIIDPDSAVNSVEDAAVLGVIAATVVAAYPDRAAWALSLAETIPDDRAQRDALKAVAAEAAATDHDLAAQAAYAIRRHHDRASALAELASAVVQQDPTRAAQLADDAEDAARVGMAAVDFGRFEHQLSLLAQATAAADTRLAEDCARMIINRPERSVAALTSVIGVLAQSRSSRQRTEELIREVEQLIGQWGDEYGRALMLIELIAAIAPLGDPWVSNFAHKVMLMIKEPSGEEFDQGAFSALVSLVKALAGGASSATEPAHIRLYQAYAPIVSRSPENPGDADWWKRAAQVASAIARDVPEMAMTIVQSIVEAARQVQPVPLEILQSEPEDPRDTKGMAYIVDVARVLHAPGFTLELGDSSWEVAALTDVAAALPSSASREAVDLAEAAETLARGLPVPDSRAEALARVAEALITTVPVRAVSLAIEAADTLQHTRNYLSAKAVARIAAVAITSPDPRLQRAVRRAVIGALGSESWSEALLALGVLAPKWIRSVCRTIVDEEKLRMANES